MTNSDNRRSVLIAVTGPAKTFKFGWWATRFALWRQGINSIYVTANNPDWPQRVSAFVIGGGDDINPKHYGMMGEAGAVYDEARDNLEIKAINYALENKLPILGICRGSQLLNIVLGGSLLSDLRPLRKRTPNRNSIFAMKGANISQGSKLHDITESDRIRVNSLHHQAVDEVGQKMKAVAHDDDGFIQATEHTERPFVVGVQWHPEYLPFSKHSKRLFARLVQITRNPPNVQE